MKNYIITFLIVCLAVLGTFCYKANREPVLIGFPIQKPVERTPGGEPPLYLFIFFSRNNCHVCMEAIQVLNKLPPPFVVTGIVPAKELKYETDLRKVTGATFELIAINETHNKFFPNYVPTIFGVSGEGRILFVLPGVPEQKGYLYNFLVNFYGKCMELLFSVSNNNGNT